MSIERSRRLSDRRKSVRALYYFMYLLGIVFISGLLLYLFLSFYPFKTVEVFNAPVPVLNSVPVRIGEAIFYESHFCKYTNAPSATLRTLEGTTPPNDKLVVTSSPQGGTAPKSKYGDIKYRTDAEGKKIFDYPCDKDNPQVRQSGGFIVPANVPEGKYRLRIVSRYQVNPIREIPYEFTTQEFTVESGATRNPAPAPRDLSTITPQTIQIIEDSEVILEPVQPPIKVETPVLPDVQLSPSSNIPPVNLPAVPEVQVEAETPAVVPKKVCLPLDLVCIKTNN